MILDSAYVLDLMHGDRDAFETGETLADRGETQWLPTPVVTEIFYGVATARSGDTARPARNAVQAYPRIDIDDEIARRAGALLARADDAAGGDAGVETTDAQIGACADVIDDTVLTENVGDFRRLGVPVESYRPSPEV